MFKKTQTILKNYCWDKWLEAVKNKDTVAKDFWWKEFTNLLENKKTIPIRSSFCDIF